MRMRFVQALVLSLLTALPALLVTASARAAVVGGFDFDRAEVAASNLVVPWGLAFLPDGSALVSERMSGRILQLRPGQTPTQVATVNGVSANGEGGLLGLAVSPNFATDQWVYAYFTSTAGDNRMVRLRLSAPQTQNLIFSGAPSGSIHDGGRIAFGPDGMLYVGAGDSGNTANAQNLSSLGGKILRMTPDGAPAPGNPFGTYVYTYGHRNVQGLAWDAQGRMYATEFGQNTTDEINMIVAGSNYGWPTCDGICNNPSFRNPIVTWTTAEASPSGLAFANNTLFAGALAGRRLWTVPLNNGTAGTPLAQLQNTFGRLRTVMVGPDGWLWITTSNRDGRGTPVTGDDRIIRVPPAGAGGDTQAPTAPAGLAASGTTASGTNLSWTASTDNVGVTGYDILRATGATGGTFAQVGTSTTTSFSDTGLTASTTYRYQVRARDAAGNVSAVSNTAQVTTQSGGTAGACTATPTVQTQWATGDVINPLTITNTSTSTINGWTVTFTLPAGHTLSGSWNATVTTSGQTVTVRPVGFNSSIAPGASITSFGFQVNRPDGNTQMPATYTCTSP